MNSIFEKQNIDKYNKLKQNIETDILIIGGGITGLLLAFKLSKNNRKVTLIEKKLIGNMSSSHNTGKVCFLQNDIHYISKKNKNEHFLNQYNAVKDFKSFILENKIECELNEVNSNLFSYINDLKDIKTILEENAIKYKYTNKKKKNNYYSCLTVYEEFTINPALFIQNIQKEFEIYTDTPIKKINYKEKKVITLNNNEVSYDTLIICSNFPFMKFKKLLGFRLYCEKSYLMSFKTKNKFKNNYTELENSGISLRKYDDFQIICGEDHKLGKKQINNPYNILENFLKKNFKEYEIINKWFNIDTLSFDKLPLIGYLTENIYISTGYNKWGLSNSFMASNILFDMITNKITSNKNNIYNPNRSFLLRNPIKITLNACRNAYFLSTTIFTNKRCSHLGCRLKYNPFTNTFDCPCHGSCFRDNLLLFGPGYDQKNNQ